MRFTVTATDGVPLAVQTNGDPDAPTVLCVHGYPDDHTVWDGVVAELVDTFHVVTYDVRGAGESERPVDRSAYRLDRLEADLAMVADAVSPRRPVHLLGHDWGSLQGWHAVTGSRLDGRVASFTSISGPCLDHIGQWIRHALCRPTRSAAKYLFRQVVLSFYIALFQLPLVPELAWKSGFAPWLMRALIRRSGEEVAADWPALSNALTGLALYRANMLQRLCAPGERRTHVPVQILAPVDDPFVAAPVREHVEWWASSVRILRVPGGHWMPRSKPQIVAHRVREFIGDQVLCQSVLR